MNENNTTNNIRFRGRSKDDDLSTGIEKNSSDSQSIQGSITNKIKTEKESGNINKNIQGNPNTPLNNLSSLLGDDDSKSESDTDTSTNSYSYTKNTKTNLHNKQGNFSITDSSFSNIERDGEKDENLNETFLESDLDSNSIHSNSFINFINGLHNNIINELRDHSNGTSNKNSNINSTDNDMTHFFKKSYKKLLSTPPKLDSCCSLNTPWERRLQTLAIAFHISTIPGFTILNFFLLSFPLLWFLYIPYLLFFYCFDRTPANGKIYKRYSNRFRSMKIWVYLCNYFPITIHKTVDLKPTFTNQSTSETNGKPSDKNVMATGPRYIFGYHPHGIGAIGAFGTFATEGCNWSKLFPGIPVSLMTLVTQFHFPLYRDYLMALGITSVSKKNALKVLNNNQSICIVVGGVTESMLSGDENAIDLVLHKRKGFVKLALQTGNVSLVPVFCFGESNCYRVYETQDGSWIHKFQLWVKNHWGFTIPIFFARGLFNYDFGLIPFRTPLDVIIGEPIYIAEKIDQPDSKTVEYYHKLYMDQLIKMFNENKDKFNASDMELKIVG